ncbi:putative receptor [Escherichia coli]|uniref:Putative receptor n=1 Tax=Escherichia coli TaxID=562 RepID=A0A377K6K2_ECOLX|nr:putative receptor [Escherichia coli]
MLRKAVGKGAYEMAYSQQENALWLCHFAKPQTG